MFFFAFESVSMFYPNKPCLWCSPRYLHGLGGSGPGCRPAGGVVAETRSRLALQLLPAQTRHEHQEGSSPGVGPIQVVPRPLQMVRVTKVCQQRNLPGGHEQGEDPAEARRGADLLLPPPDLQGFQTGGGLVHQLLTVLWNEVQTGCAGAK